MKNQDRHSNGTLNRFWISFDLGLRGNYEALYRWLDGLEAQECGDSVATFTTQKNRDHIQKELSSCLARARVREST